MDIYSTVETLHFEMGDIYAAALTRCGKTIDPLLDDHLAGRAVYAEVFEHGTHNFVCAIRKDGTIIYRKEM